MYPTVNNPEIQGEIKQTICKARQNEIALLIWRDLPPPLFLGWGKSYEGKQRKETKQRKNSTLALRDWGVQKVNVEKQSAETFKIPSLPFTVFVITYLNTNLYAGACYF